MALFPKTPKWESQNWDYCCFKTLDAHIFLKKTYLERARAQSYSLKSDIFNGVLHAPIKDYLTFAQRGFVFRNEIPNLTLDPFFYHNASISCLNE
jgi:hypothetical protein